MYVVVAALCVRFLSFFHRVSWWLHCLLGRSDRTRPKRARAEFSDAESSPVVVSRAGTNEQEPPQRPCSIGGCDVFMLIELLGVSGKPRC